MKQRDLVEMVRDFHSEDEVVLLSPGGKELVVTGLDLEAISRTGRVVLTTDWLNPPKPKEQTEAERLLKEKARIEKELKKVVPPAPKKPTKKYNRKPASEYGTKLGRPKKSSAQDVGSGNPGAE